MRQCFGPPFGVTEDFRVTEDGKLPEKKVMKSRKRKRR
jgi:hypothetical protein